MKEYHKIQTVFKRDPANNHKTLLMGEYSLPEFEYLANNIWVFTEKVDGTNIRIGVKAGAVVVGGRTDNAQVPTFFLNRLTQKISGQGLLDVFEGEDFCLYGEGYGAKIQKGGGNYIPDSTDFVLFDVRVGHWWLKREDVCDVAAKLGISVVPIIGEGTLANMILRVRDGIVSNWGDFPAEGIVARPATELYNRNNHRVITKIKTKDFPR